MSDLAADASRAADEDDRYQEALKTIERVERRRARRQEAAQFEAEQLSALAQRSATTVTGGQDLLAGAKRALAGRQAIRAREIAHSAPRTSYRSGRPFGGRPAAPGPVETSRAELMALGYGESSRGGCPPCSACHYVICRCSQYPPGEATGRAGYAAAPELSRVVADAMVSVR